MVTEITVRSESCGEGDLRGLHVDVRGDDSRVLIDPNVGPPEHSGYRDTRSRFFTTLTDDPPDAVLGTHLHADHVGILDRCLEKTGLEDEKPRNDKNGWGYILNGKRDWIPVNPSPRQEKEFGRTKYHPINGRDSVQRWRRVHWTYDGEPLSGPGQRGSIYMNSYGAEVDGVGVYVSGDIHGIWPEDALEDVREMQPEVIVMDGPSYSRSNEKAWRKARESTRRVLEAVPELEEMVVDHHACRWGDGENTVREIAGMASQAGSRANVRRACDLPRKRNGDRVLKIY